MQIVYVVPYFAPAWGYGGPPRQVFDLSRQMVRFGHSVHVVTTDALDGARRVRERRGAIDGVSVDRVRNLSNSLAWKHQIFLPIGFRKAFRDALARADVVHLFDFRDLQNALALGPLSRTRIPYLLSAFGELPRATGLKRQAKHLYDNLWGYRLLREASALIAQTDDEAVWYARFGGRRDQIRTIPLAIDLDGIQRASTPGAFKARLGITPRERMILFLGRIHEYKGIELLIRAYSRVRELRSDIRLVIAGRDDGFLAEAERLARQLTPTQSVLFCGPLYGDNRFDAYGDADLFAITPSHAEQTSLAALEACACGTPVLVTEQAPIPGLDACGAGRTVPHNEAAVTTALEQLLDANLESMGVCASMLVRRQFALPAVAAALEKTYREAASTSPFATIPVG